MVSHLFFYQLMVLGLLWLCVMLHYAWPNECTGGDQKPSKPLPPPCKCSSAPKPFPGLTCKPCCAACEQAPQEPAAPPPASAPTADHLQSGTPAPSGHLAAVLPQSGLCVSGSGGARQSQCEWSSQRWPLATAVLQPM